MKESRYKKCKVCGVEVKETGFDGTQIDVCPSCCWKELNLEVEE